MKKYSKEPQFSWEFEDSGTSEEETPKKKNTLIANVSGICISQNKTLNMM